MNELITAFEGLQRSGGRFVKGQSGNPAGRPAVPADTKELFRGSSPDAAQLLIDTMNDPTAKLELRVKCAETIIERVLGKAVQPIAAEVATATVNWNELTTEELRRLASYESEDADDSESGED